MQVTRFFPLIVVKLTDLINPKRTYTMVLRCISRTHNNVLNCWSLNNFKSYKNLNVHKILYKYRHYDTNDNVLMISSDFFNCLPLKFNLSPSNSWYDFFSKKWNLPCLFGLIAVLLNGWVRWYWCMVKYFNLWSSRIYNVRLTLWSWCCSILGLTLLIYKYDRFL